jgi:hypothetical protein
VRRADPALLDGQTLYVGRTGYDLIAVVNLDPGATAGEVTDELTDLDVAVPTTVADSGNDLYAVDARYGVENPGSAAYDVVRVST